VTQGLIDLQGAAADSRPGDAISYQVLVHPFGDESTVLANVTPPPLDAMGFHDSGDNHGDLGTNDFSTLANGVYDLELIVRGGGGEAHATNSFQLQSDLKIGQFSFSEQDLTLPVNGIPLTVTRTYNSLNPDSGPFGTSWNFALNDMDVQLDDVRQTVTVDGNSAFLNDDGNTDGTGGGLPEVVNMRVDGNWDVTLTMPDGRRVTFQADYDGSTPNYSFFWNAPTGVHATLEAITLQGVGDAHLDWGPDGTSGLVWADEDFLQGPQPYQYSDIAGWVLTTQNDGTKYYITRGSPTNVVCADPADSTKEISARVYGPPKLTMIKPVSGDLIVITNTGVFHYDPSNNLTRSILFDHDSQGRVTALHDPNGGSNGLPAVRYIYDNDNNNLVQVLKLVDRSAGTYTTNKYDYNNPNFPHYITSIENGDGIPVARNFYDDSGRLTAVQDANGTTTYFNHSTTNNTDVVVDRLGNTNSYVYDLRGNVIWQTNALGQITASTYGDANNPTLETAVTNAYGTAVATWTLYAYDQSGNQTNVVSMGHTNSFSYDDSGHLLSQVDPLGNVTSNLYDDFGNLTNTTQYDANNNPVTQSSSVYANGYLTKTLDANNQITATFIYDGSGNLTNITDANGLSRNFAYDANGNQTNSSYQWVPPGGGSPTNVTTRTYYDALNRVVQTVDALGNTSSTSYDSAGKVAYTIDKFGNTTSMLYDALGNLIQTTYPKGPPTQTVYDTAGRAYLTTDRNGTSGTMTSYDAQGRVTNVVRLTNVVVNINYNGSVADSIAVTTNGPISTNSTVYDAAGRVASRTSPDGTTSYDYYPDGQVMYVTDPLTNTIFYAYDAADRRTNMVDALMHSTKFQYDALGRTIATIFDDNSSVSNVFNNLGQRVQAIDQATNVTQFAYNLSDQLTNVVKPAVPDPEHSGNLTNATWSYYYDTYGHQIATTDPKGRATTNEFDAFSRQFSQRLPGTQTNLALYNSLGQLKTNYDFMGQRTELRYDQFGQLTNTYYFVPGQTHPSNAVSYAYDQLGRVTDVIQRYGSDAANSYTLLDNGGQRFQPVSIFAKAVALVTTSGPKWGGPFVAFAAFCLVFILVPGGRKLRDILVWYILRGGWKALPKLRFRERRISPYKLARWVPSHFWRAVTLVTLAIYIFDDPAWNRAFGQCSPPASDNIANSTLTTRITTYTYDFDGHMTQMNSPEGYINYEYDSATGRLTNTCTAYSAIGYSYDALGRLQYVHVTERNASAVNEWTTNKYDKVGNRSEVDLPNGVVTKYYYDTLNRLANMTHQAGTTNLASYTYTLNASGRRTNAVEILRIPDAEGGGYYTNNLSWQFDGMYRLTSEVNQCSVSGASYTNVYAYDLVGNRLQLTQTTGNVVTTTNSYDANDELLREVAQTNGIYSLTNNYAYDPNGSMIGRTNIGSTLNINVYTYDLRNKLSSVMSGNSTTSFQYNDQGIRVRTMGASTKYYLIDSNNRTGYQQVLEEFSTLSGAPTMSYVIGDDVLGQGVSGPASYLLADGRGSARQIASPTGGVTERYNYDACGVMQTANSSSEYATDNTTSHLYCREQYDVALQMYNLRARYYSPSNGRFNQRDTFAAPNEDPQSMHKYLYANCDPVNGRDPSGHFTLLELTVVVIIIALLVVLLLPTLQKALDKGRRTHLMNDLRSLPAFRADTLKDLSVNDQGVIQTPVNVGGSQPAPTLPLPWTSQDGTWMGWPHWNAFRRGSKDGPPVLVWNAHIVNNADPSPHHVSELIAFVQADPDFIGRQPKAPSHWRCEWVGSETDGSNLQDERSPFTYIVGRYYDIPLDVKKVTNQYGTGLAIVDAGTPNEILPSQY
jgi:RHS repeat-associated protein